MAQQKTQFKVGGMACSFCTESINKALGEDLLVGEAHVYVGDAVGAAIRLLDALRTERAGHPTNLELRLLLGHRGRGNRQWGIEERRAGRLFGFDRVPGLLDGGLQVVEFNSAIREVDLGGFFLERNVGRTNALQPFEDVSDATGAAFAVQIGNAKLNFGYRHQTTTGLF